MKTLYIQFGKLILLVGMLTSSGCFTVMNPHAARESEVQKREDLLIVQEDNRRLAGRVESLELQIDRLQQDIDQLRQQQRGMLDDVDERIEGRLSRVEDQVAVVDAARLRDRDEIVEKLSSKISQVMTSSGRSSGGSYTRAASGLEHTVGVGQTLSEIAKAYGVTMQAIIRENNLKNPNQLRVGQKLFIPE